MAKKKAEQPQPEKRPPWRPTDYRPEFCERVIELGKQGYSVTEMACDLGVVKSTLWEWEQKYADFSNALTRAKAEAQAWFEKMGRENLTADKFQASLWAKQVSCRFPDDYREKKDINHTIKTHEQSLREIMGEND